MAMANAHRFFFMGVALAGRMVRDLGPGREISPAVVAMIL